MGHSFESVLAAPDALELFKPPLGIDLSFCTSEETVLVIKTSTLSSSYEVTDEHGTPVVRCEGKGIRPTKELFHPETGALLYSLETKWTCMTKTAVDASGKELFKVTHTWTLGKAKLTLDFIDTSTGNHAQLLLTSLNVLDNDALITYGDRLVAKVKKDGLRSPYLVTVAPGVDVSLLAAFCIAYHSILIAKGTTIGLVPTKV